MDQGKLFPVHMHKGSRGPAVMIFQLALIGWDYNSANIVADGDYGEQTAAGVRELQEVYNDTMADEDGNDAIEVDGNYGPETARAIFDMCELDFGALPMPPNPEMFAMRGLYVGPNGVGTEAVKNDAP